VTPDPKDDEDDKKRFALLNEKKKVSVRPKPEKKIVKKPEEVKVEEKPVTPPPRKTPTPKALTPKAETPVATP
jgi:hypothetical protein